MRRAFAAAALLAAPAMAQDGTLTDRQTIARAEVTDLITRYYYAFGKAEGDAFSAYYADDAELTFGPKRYQGKQAIADAYKAIGAGPTNPATGRFSFNVVMTNPLVTVHGDTATAQLIFTEIVMDTATAPPRLLTQGREYDDLVRTSGGWRFKRRQIVAGTTPPEGWRN